ncbi:MAG: hypothetical protein Q9227_000751 [Pyrenula ochraceoflavens]
MAGETAAKRLKTAPLIGTHNGHFHADEALAVYMLRLLPKYTDSPLVRTRDRSVLDTCDIVVDVGDVYDHSNNRFDHHQRTFTDVFPDRLTRLSSAGLVYKHFGKAVIAQHAKLPIDHADVEIVYQKLYDDFIEAVDANDNGINAYDSGELKAAGIQKKFNEFGVTLASLVRDLNQEDPLTPNITRATPENPQAEEDYRFSEASSLMGKAFLRRLHGMVTVWLPARAIVEEAFKNRTQNDSSGRILVLPKAGIPWANHLYNFEEEASLPEEEKILYVLYPEKEDLDSRWRIQAVAKESGSFENRKSLPETWRGNRDTDLDNIIGDDVEDGAVFVHASGFIGGHRTELGARAMASKALAS